MSIYRKHRRNAFTMNAAALPDLIFVVLFFFMVVTHMRKANVRVEYKEPQGTALTRLTKKSLTYYIYVGQPKGKDGKAKAASPVIQLNDRIVTVADITYYLSEERRGLTEEEQKQMTVSIKSDKDVPLQTIIDIKQALRSANTLNILYAATEEDKKEK